MSAHLVIGASGQVGEHLLRRLRESGQVASGTYYEHAQPGLLPLDMRNQEAVSALVKAEKPQYVYLVSGLTNVDYCELHPDAGYALNVLGVSYVSRAANEAGAKVVYFSTDYVFDGTRGPYAETDVPRPLSEYGRQKLLGEHGVALHAQEHLIIRTTVVYGWESQGKNFVQRLVTSLRQGQRVRVPRDQIGSPTYTPNLAAAAVELTTGGASGVYHIAGPAMINRAEFALAVAKNFGLDPGLIEPVTTKELGQAAPRPLLAGMRVEKAQAVLKTRLVDYREGLNMMVMTEPSGVAMR